MELLSRADGRPEGMLVIGRETGSDYGWHPGVPSLLGEAATAAFATSLGGSSLADRAADDTARAPHDRAH